MSAAKKPSGGRSGASKSSGSRSKPTKKTTAKKTSKRTSSRPAKLDSASLARIRKQLEEERVSLEAQMTELEEESFQGTQSELTGEVGIDEDFADAGSATFDREQALSIQNNIRDLIDQVERALARIREGTYGSCERCGKPIDAA